MPGVLELRAVVKLETPVWRILRALVHESGIKQDAIGRAIGKDQTWVSKYTRRKLGKRATLADLSALANFFDRDLSSVLKDAEQRRRRPLTRDEMWLALGRSLRPAERKMFEGLIRAVVKARRA